MNALGVNFCGVDNVKQLHIASPCSDGMLRCVLLSIWLYAWLQWVIPSARGENPRVDVASCWLSMKLLFWPQQSIPSSKGEYPLHSISKTGCCRNCAGSEDFCREVSWVGIGHNSLGSANCWRSCACCLLASFWRVSALSFAFSALTALLMSLQILGSFSLLLVRPLSLAERWPISPGILRKAWAEHNTR